MKVKYKILITSFIAFALVPLLVIYTSAEKETIQVSYLNFFANSTFAFSYEDDSGNVISDGYRRSNPNVYQRWIDGDEKYTCAVFTASDPSEYTQVPNTARGEITTTFPLLTDSDKYGELITDQDIGLCYAFTNGDYPYFALNPNGCYIDYEDPDGRVIRLNNSGINFNLRTLYNAENDPDSASFMAYVCDIGGYAFTQNSLHYGGNFKITFLWNFELYSDFPTIMYVGIKTDSYISFGTNGDLPPSDTEPPVTVKPSLPEYNETLDSKAENVLDILDRITMPEYDLNNIPFDPQAIDMSPLWSSDFGGFAVVLIVVSLGLSTIGYLLHGKR